MDFLFFSRSGSAVGTLAPSFGGRDPTLGIAFGTFFFVYLYVFVYKTRHNTA